MRMVTDTYPVYKYSELTGKARENARQWYLDDETRTHFFTEDCNEYLSSLFPASKVKVEYSLNYCQGDGLNIYGDIYLDEVIEQIKDKFTEKEIKFFEWVFDTFGSRYNMKHNHLYTYCICDGWDFSEDIIEDLEWRNYRGIPYQTLEKMTKEIQVFLGNVCKRLEKDGYEYFYEVPDETIIKDCNTNNWEFTEDGNFYR